MVVEVPLSKSSTTTSIQTYDDEAMKEAIQASLQFETNMKNENKPKTKWYKNVWRRDKLMILIVIGVLCGFMIGILSNKKIQTLEVGDKQMTITLMGFPGELLMRMLKMLILPLIVSSLIVGLSELDQQSSGKLGRRAVLYYMGTTFLAVVLGIILVLAIRPGRSGGRIPDKGDKSVRPLDSFLDLIRNMFPPNIVQATLEQTQTGVEKIKTNIQNHTIDVLTANDTKIDQLKAENNFFTVIVNSTYNYSYYQTWETVKLSGPTKTKPGTNILGMVVFSIALGMILGRMGEKAKVFVKWVSVLNDVVMELVSLVMWYSPIGICSLIAAKFADMADIQGTFADLGLYMATVIAGLVIHSLVVLPATYFVCTRKNPFNYVKGLIQAILTAFGTASSSATLPVTFRCLETNNGVDKRVTRFVLPIGATINMDGTALYEAVAAIFIAQATGVQLGFGGYVAISLTSTLASIGAAGIPQAGLVTMLIVLQTVGLPEDAVTLIISVDWFLDRLRTAVNVMGDGFGAGIVAHLSRDDLTDLPMTIDSLDNVEKGVENASFDEGEKDEKKRASKIGDSFELDEITINSTL